MSGFIMRAACHGRRPSPFVSHIARGRSALTTRMLKDRKVARFIVAPDGYGKTSLALEYAETMFSWAHTFWVNAQSPCFIRDLDAGVLASGCLAADADAQLVVFDDLPPCEPHRMEAFSAAIDLLLASGCEVVVTCVPSCDMVGFLQRDRIRLGACDLLLDDAELDESRTAEERVRRPAGKAGPAERVAALAWSGDEDATCGFAKAALGEGMPSDLLLVVASVLVLQSGSFADVLAMGPIDKEVLAEVLHDYPHLGFDGDIDCFEAPRIGMDALAVPLKPILPDLAACSSFDAPERLVLAWAGALLAAGRAGRACDLVREACPRSRRPDWLIGHARELVAQACFFPMFRIARDLDSCKGAARIRLGAIEALCRMVLGDEEGALRCAKSHAFDASAPADVRICELLVAGRLGKGALAAKVHDALEAEADAGRDLGELPYPSVDWPLLARAWCAGSQGALEVARLWGESADGQAGDVELGICASWLFGLIDAVQDEVAASPEVRRCERYVRSRLQGQRGSDVDYFAASAGLSLEEARNRGVRSEGGLLDAESLIHLRKVEMGVLSQRRLFEEDVRMARARHNDWANTHPDTIGGKVGDLASAQSWRSVPVLTVRLFGHFEVAIGGVVLDAGRFNRRNARTLLALLAVNQGRELPREAVERAMWPLSGEEVAHKNFYTVWSSLRRALTLPDGTCPYLVRHQYGCCLESRYVHSDVERFGEICRELLFGVPNVDKWSLLFAELDRDFSSDLMPAERKNRLVVQARNEYRSRLVDALVAATLSVIEIENPQWGIWFARAALNHDETREDAYVALMRAQVAANQRTAAMATFLKCRRVLSDQLGIDPSPETTLLYESLLDAE